MFVYRTFRRLKKDPLCLFTCNVGLPRLIFWDGVTYLSTSWSGKVTALTNTKAFEFATRTVVADSGKNRLLYAFMLAPLEISLIIYGTRIFKKIV